jgi:hypothetical protein
MANETELQRLEQALREADRRGDTQNATIFAQALMQAQQQMGETHTTTNVQSAPPPESEAFKSGRAMPTWARRGLHIADVLGMGLPKKFMSPEGEQMVRGAKAEFAQSNPIESGVESFVGSMAPAVATGGATLEPIAARTATKIAGPLITAGRAAMQAAPQGALQSVGESESRDPTELLKAAAEGGAFAGVLGGATSGLGQGGMNIVRNVAARTTERGAMTDAQRELIKALSRDVPYGSVFDRVDSISTPAGRGMARLNTLGPEARVVDIGGQSTRQLADVLATLPGRAKQSFERAIAERQAGRAGRLMTAADDALGTGGKQYAPTIDALVQERSAAAGPLYDQLRGVAVPVDPKMAKLLAASRSAHRDTELLAELRQQTGLDLDKLKVGDAVPFDALDHLKQSLYDLETAAKKAGANNKASAYTDLRRELTAHMDDVLPKDKAGNSIYAQAREAYAGPSQIADAVELGRSALGEKPVELAGLTAGLTGSEVEGFRIGALQALREQVGKESGQTSLLKMWKEPATADKLRLIFGDDYRQFAAAVAKERNLKAMESVGRGSQTASRLSAAEDLGADLVAGAGEVAAAGKTGNIGGMIAGAKRLGNKIALPESTRNQLAQLLLQRGGDAQTTLRTLDEVIQNINRRRAAGAAAAGSIGAQEQQALFPQQ